MIDGDPGNGETRLVGDGLRRVLDLLVGTSYLIRLLGRSRALAVSRCRPQKGQRQRRQRRPPPRGSRHHPAPPPPRPPPGAPPPPRGGPGRPPPGPTGGAQLVGERTPRMSMLSMV